MRARATVLIALLLVTFVAAPANADRQAAPSDREAVRVARRVLRALGGREAWEETRYLAWSFFGKRSHVWDRRTNRLRMESGELTVLLDLNTGEGRALRSGEELVGDDLAAALRGTRGAWVNDSYWLLMPYKLTDPGVRLRHHGTRALPDGREAEVLGLTFSAVGLTPHNRYEVLVDARTHLVERWSYFSNAADTEARFDRPFSGWQRRGDIMLPDHGNGFDSSVLEVVPSVVFEELRPISLEEVRDMARIAEASGTMPGSLQSLRPGLPQRVVAVGDVHGDLDSAREALRLAGAIDSEDRWIGGPMIVVQVGDQLDRGDDEREILDLFERLRVEARAAGGAFHALLGNHETMNVRMDFRYVTEGGWTSFADLADPDDETLAEYPEEQRGRVAAFRPGGRYAKLLASHDLARIVGGSVFVHGGLLVRHAELGLDEINAAVRAWMLGEAERPEILTTKPSPVWSRHYSKDTDAEDCQELEEVLALLGVERMVVAHTVQEEGITSACGDGVWRVDVGLSDHYGGETSVLEIVGDSVRVLR